MLLNESHRTFGPGAGDDAAASVLTSTAAGETVTVVSGVRAFSPAEAATVLGISRSGVQRRIVSGEISAFRVGNRYYVSEAEIGRVRTKLTTLDDVPPPPHRYPAVYAHALFPFLDGDGDARFFVEDAVTATAEDRAALSLLTRSGAAIRWGDGLSLSSPHRALMIFAVTELQRLGRVRWSAPEDCAPLIADGSLITGSGEAVLARLNLDPNPIAEPLPPTIWHGTGPETFTSTARPGAVPWVADALTGTAAPLAVAYADLFGTPGWSSEAFADYVTRLVMGEEE